MDQHQSNFEFEKTLEESKSLLEDASRAADEDYAFTLEGILEEFGGTGDHPAADRELAALGPAAGMRLPELPEENADDTPPEASDAWEADEADVAPALDTPRIYSLQQVLERTVRDVLEQQRQEPVLEEASRWGLFSHKKRRETEELYEPADAEQQEPAAKKPFGRQRPGPPKEPEPPVPPEPPIEETVAEYRGAMQNTRRVARFSALITLLMWTPQFLDRLGWMPAVYIGERLLNTLPFFVALLLVCVLGREVFVYAVEKLKELKVTYELLTALLCCAGLADTAAVFFSDARGASGALPLHSVAALSMVCALWGRSMLFRALYDSFRIAAIGDAPYIVTTTVGGAAKRRGGAEGFSTLAQQDDVSGRWQTIVLPVLLAASAVFSVLSTLQAGSWPMFWWNLSAILAGANTLAFPLVYPLPLRRVTHRFAKSGSALAGYQGAAVISRSNCLTLTDSDLFPPGAVTLNGLKIFGEDNGKVFSYAATMARASEIGLARLFESLLAQEGGKPEPLSDLNFYEEGGVGGTIHGETVLFGTAAFCRKMGVTLPAGLKLQTGVFLAVDGALIAIFAVKYMAAENVDWAMHALGRAHITPVLAARDGNITPQLLKRKFGTTARAVYPRLSMRLALSEKEGENPCALIYREGLSPYAELAIGGKRLCHAVRLGNVLSLLASVTGTMLAFYLSFSAAYGLFTPFKLVLFMGLWALAALVDGFFADRY